MTLESLRQLPPGTIMIVGALFLPLLGRRLAGWGALALTVASLALFWTTPPGSYGAIELFGQALHTIRIDKLSFLFALIFHFAAVITAIYALHVGDVKQHVAGMVYAGAAIAASCAGDLISLFVFWELTAIASVFLIWASNNLPAYRAGMRYLIIQVTSGVLLLSGAVMRFVESGSLDFGQAGELGIFSIDDWSGRLILLAFGIKCAFPLLHNWLQDSYPQGTASGTVFLSAFTTKLAVYSLARGFAGTEQLIWIGTAMTLFPIVFAVIENDLRRVLSYSLNNQLGFMVVGIGIGTELAVNGTAAHAFCHILYKALLFMSMGAVLHRVGTTKATDLGGLHKSMPWTTLFCTIGAASIAGFPLLSGFVSKSMILAAAAEEHHFIVFVLLLVASAGVMEHSGIKIPYFAFFGHDSGKRVQEAPWNMLLAMAIAAGFCVGLGVAYPLLYRMLPFESDYVPYTVAHVITQLQLLLFAALAFVVLLKTRQYPAEVRAINLDTDWIYRRLMPRVVGVAGAAIALFDTGLRKAGTALLRGFLGELKSGFDDNGLLGRTWTTSAMAVWATLLLGLCLVLYYF